MPKRFFTFLNLHKLSLLLVLVSAVFYTTFGHFLIRTDFIKLISLFAALFVLYFKLIQFEKWNFRFLLVAGILFRATFLLAEPNLSQDYFRFIWDGQLIVNAINPYLYVPNTLMEQTNFTLANANVLHEGMGALSAKHYSNYPPLNQLIFAVSTFFGANSILGSILVMRTTIILADIGIFYVGRKLLRNLNMSPQMIFWYFLNPLIIIELTGNLHFEGVMLFFFILSIYLLSVKKWILAALALAFSISVKLVPLLFLPLFLTYFGWKKSIVFYIMVGLTSILLFLPFYTPVFYQHYTETLSLWFSNFEFNAGLYNLVKKIAVHYDIKPWEFIKMYGKITPVINITVVALFSFLRKNSDLKVLLSSMMWVLTIYYLIGTTVHPWYISFLVLLGIFTSFKYSVVWSAAIVLSYFAYSHPDFNENLWLLALEYISVFVFILYEIIAYRNKK